MNETVLILSGSKAEDLESLMVLAQELGQEVSIKKVSGDQYEIKLEGPDENVRKFVAKVVQRAFFEELNMKFENSSDRYVASNESAQFFLNMKPDHLFLTIFAYLLILGGGFLIFGWIPVADHMIIYSFFFLLAGIAYRITTNRYVEKKTEVTDRNDPDVSRHESLIHCVTSI